MRPFVTILTLTGDRPKTFELCRQYVERQTYDGPIQWLIVDDGVDQTSVRGQRDYHRRCRDDDEPRITITRQMIYALDHIKGDIVVLMEDDDWYHPRYVDAMVQSLDKSLVAGPRSIFYYHVPAQKFFVSNIGVSTAFFQTAFRSCMIPEMREVCRVSDGVVLLDRNFWMHVNPKHKNLFETDPNDPGQVSCIGMKGLPGRQSATKHHLHSRYVNDDRLLVYLRHYIGDDVQNYMEWLGT